MAVSITVVLSPQTCENTLNIITIVPVPGTYCTYRVINRQIKANPNLYNNTPTTNSHESCLLLKLPRTTTICYSSSASLEVLLKAHRCTLLPTPSTQRLKPHPHTTSTLTMDGNNNNRIANVPDHGAMMAVVSGDSEGEDIYSIASDARSVDTTASREAKDQPQGDGFLYDENLDDEDARYVYMNLRGGKHDGSQKPTEGKDVKSTATNSSQAVQKPRNSDAVLSCPCCFRILSLDTQKHHKYPNQFRAMFVMGISVDWQHLLKYDSKVQGLVRWYPTGTKPTTDTEATQIVAPDHNRHSNSFSDDPIYYAVSCANCQTMVAALDMTDECYHFYDCLASA